VISAAEMATLRTIESQAFTASATVYGKVSVADTSGGFTDSYVARGTYSCSFGPSQVRPREVEAANRIQLVGQWTFVFPSTATVLPTDRVHVGTRAFEVVSSGIGSEDIVLRVNCTEIL
jgi:hypothetical protein